jgi:hypothetical protein
MEAAFCVETLEDALARHGKPDIFNTDQGSQFTGTAFTGVSSRNSRPLGRSGHRRKCREEWQVRHGGDHDVRDTAHPRRVACSRSARFADLASTSPREATADGGFRAVGEGVRNRALAGWHLRARHSESCAPLKANGSVAGSALA